MHFRSAKKQGIGVDLLHRPVGRNSWVEVPKFAAVVGSDESSTAISDDLGPWVRTLGFRTRNVIELFGSHVGTKPRWIDSRVPSINGEVGKNPETWYFGKATKPR